MRLHDLKPAAGSHRDRKRIGRGNASGQGTTAGKGTKGQNARSGGPKAGFRGISSRNFRLAKRRGFTNRFQVSYQVVNVDRLSFFEAGAVVTFDALAQAGMITASKGPAKILGDGELDRAIQIVGLKVSASARQKIESAGGSVAAPVEEAADDSGSV